MKIFRFTVIVAIISILSKLAGFVREAIIANELGISNAADAIYVALTLPNIFQFVIGAAIANALIPVLTKSKSNLLFSNIIISLTVIFIFLGTILYFSTDLIVSILAPSLDDTATDIASNTMKILIPASLFIGLGAVYKQILQAEEKIITANISQLILNVAVIFSLIILPSIFSSTVSFALGMVIGSILMVIVQHLSLRNRYRLEKFIYTSETKEVYIISLTIMMGLMVNQLFTITNRIIASSLEEGSISSLTYAERIIQLPLGIVAQSLAIVIFPFLATYVANKEIYRLENLVKEAITIIFLVTLPLVMFIIVFNQEIVTLLYGRGAFDAVAINSTSSALIMFSFMLLAQSVMMVLTRFYYAIQKPKVPLFTIIFTVVINIILALVLKESMGHEGIALANTISMSINAILLILLLNKQNISIKNIFSIEMLKIFLASLIFLVTALIFNSFLFIINIFIDLLFKSSVLIILYIILLLIFREELSLRLSERILNYIRRK